jgi:hypothetical protein
MGGAPGSPMPETARKVLVLENRAQVITQGQIGMASGKGGMGNPSGLLGYGTNGLRAQEHHGGPSVSGAEA